MNAILHAMYLISSIALIVGGLWLIMQWQENRNLLPSETIFVYGTLTNPLIRFYACRCVVESQPATAQGFQKKERTINPDASSAVEGQLLRVTRVELARFDAYEDVPNTYVRRPIEVNRRTVWAYFRIAD